MDFPSRLLTWRPGAVSHYAIVLVVSTLAGGAVNRALGEAPADDDLAFVRDKVQPLLVARCYECHGPEKHRQEKEPAGGLLLSSHRAMLTGGDSGPAIVPGKPDESLLVEAINWDGVEMPPKSKMPAGEIAILTRWIEAGAAWPEGNDEPVVAAKPFPLAARRASHWAWRAIARPETPAVDNGAWPRGDIDRFIAARREAAGLNPADDADPGVLLRRLYFDVAGLPPSPEALAAFEQAAGQDRAKAVEAAADQLLASPQFGERWARHWLDLVRYAETRGHEFDVLAANAYQYRDYVIRALNADVPYNEVVVEHIAGDLLETPRRHPAEGFNESVLATAFWYLGDWVHAPTDIRKDETDRIDNAIDTLSRALLGLTVACARCHDHKFDAISTADYYALAGYLQSSQYRQVRFDSIEHNRQIARQLWERRRQRHAGIRQSLTQQWLPTARRAAAYLLAAGDVVAERPESASTAAAQPLDPKLLNAWATELREARSDPRHPLAPFAAVNGGHVNESAGRLDAVRQASGWPSMRRLVDYARLDPGEWIQDGFAFGPGPQAPGDLQMSHQGGAVVFDVAAGSAQFDTQWPRLEFSGERDAEGLGKVQPSGRTLRTPVFTIGEHPIWMLVRGQADYQLVVASHRLIRGPLHTQLVGKFDTHDKPAWVRLPTGRYLGERVHVELVGHWGEMLEIMLVAEGDKPPSPASGLAPAWLAVGDDAQRRSVSDWAVAYQQAMVGGLERFAAGTIRETDDPAAEAALVRWMLGNPTLFAAETSAPQRFAAEFFAAEGELLAKVQTKSRTAIAIWDGTAENERLLIRGSSSNPGKPVPRRFLEALGGRQHPAAGPGSGRLELAHQMTDPQQNPFLARVIVNRVWHHLFGRGLVPTVDNFGVLGQPPSHPLLLDRLASDFIDDGWSLKRLIRRIVTSRTYQMSSHTADTRTESADPQIVLLHRMRLRRLEGESIRDAILAISGQLDPSLFGPPVEMHLTPFLSGRGRPEVSGPLDGAGRRSIYQRVRRNFLAPMMLAFDMPPPLGPVGRRNSSNVPAQSLILMNDPFVHEQARRWEERLRGLGLPTSEARIERMYLEAFSRPPRPEEIAAGRAFLAQQAAALGAPQDAWQQDPRAWSEYGHALWNAKEFIFIQ